MVEASRDAARACGHPISDTRWCPDCDEAQERAQRPAATLVDLSGLTAEQAADVRAHVRGLTEERETYPMPAHGWTCFHCGETFRTPGGARLHFGKTPDQTPKCLVDGTLRASGWRPIETAPKDGTAVDLWCGEEGRTTDCYWGFPDHTCGEAGSYCDSDWHSLRAPGWVDGTFNHIIGRSFGPTHWMPRPDAPNQPSPEGPSR